MKRKGRLVTLEGNEGCGKTTQIKLLYNYLRRQGHRVFLTREPGGTRISDEIRKVLLDNKNHEMTPVCETLLYMASRAQLVDEVIAPKLKRGVIVLCDRWLDATVAYQGYGAGVSIDWIRLLGRQVTKGIEPDLSIFLNLPLRCGLRRAKSFKNADRLENKALRFHERVRRGYLAIARKEPRRFRRLDIRENDTVAAVHEKIKRMIEHVV